MRSIWVIGVKKQIIAVNVGLVNVAMLNPAICKKSRPFETEEGCLSLTGTRKTKRFREIELE
jgi:peptide deformylase